MTSTNVQLFWGQAAKQLLMAESSGVKSDIQIKAEYDRQLFEDLVHITIAYREQPEEFFQLLDAYLEADERKNGRTEVDIKQLEARFWKRTDDGV